MNLMLTERWRRWETACLYSFLERIWQDRWLFLSVLCNAVFPAIETLFDEGCRANANANANTNQANWKSFSVDIIDVTSLYMRSSAEVTVEAMSMMKLHV